MKLSIIIPVYNVSPYVQRCLESVLGQDVPAGRHEVIVVDDGSTDESLALVRHAVGGRGHVTVVSQENRGLSAARNRGLALAQGEYVWFVDSDDWIAEGCLSKIIPLLDQNPDCLLFKYTVYYNEQRQRVAGFPFSNTLSGMELLKRSAIPTPAPFTLFKKDLFSAQDLFFQEGIFHEDSELVPKLYYYARTALFLDEVCYYYFQREGSIMSSFSPQKARDILRVNERLLSFAKEKIGTRSQRALFYNWIGLNTNSLLSRLSRLPAEDLAEIRSLFLQQHALFRAMRHAEKRKYKLEGLLLGIAPRLGFRFAIHSPRP